MEYILISLLAITITTYLVYKIANNIFAVHLKLKPLLLCAGCALFISLVIPRVIVGYAGMVGTAAVVTVIAVIFAYYVAYYDDKQHKEPAQSLGEPQVNAVSIMEQQEFAIDPTFISSPSRTASPQETDAVATNAVTENTDQETVPDPESDWWVDFSMLTNTVTETASKSNSLEDLLEYGFAQKEQHNYPQALQAFRTALKLYFESEVAPFLVVEIGDLLKNKGAYDEAIRIFTYGRTLPELQKNSSLEQEFVNTIAYLRIIKNVLLQKHLGFIPFKDISQDIKQQIEKEFSEWNRC